jgi:hypothetical protein
MQGVFHRFDAVEFGGRARGRWQIAAHLVKSELWQQLQLVPHGTHDDGPDAMERAGSMLASSVDRAAFYGRDAPSTPSAGAGMPRGWR